MACNKTHKYYDPLYEKPEEFKMWINYLYIHWIPLCTYSHLWWWNWPSGSKAWFLLILIQYHVLLISILLSKGSIFYTILLYGSQLVFYLICMNFLSSIGFPLLLSAYPYRCSSVDLSYEAIQENLKDCFGYTLTVCVVAAFFHLLSIIDYIQHREL